MCIRDRDLGADALGNLTRIENELSKLPARLEAAKTKKAETIAQLETAKEEIKKPFAFEDELKEKTERQMCIRDRPIRWEQAKPLKW